MFRTLSNKLQGVDEATRRAQSFPVLLCHGKGKFMELNIIFLFVNEISRKKSVKSTTKRVDQEFSIMESIKRKP